MHEPKLEDNDVFSPQARNEWLWLVWCLVVDSRCQCYSAVEQSGCKYRCLTLSSLSVEKPGCYKGYI